MSFEFRSTASNEIPTDVRLFQRLKMAYKGSGDFADGSILSKHDRETTNSYQRRKASVSYSNYFRPLIDTIVNAIFGKEPTREMTQNAQAELFVDNVDGRNDLSGFMRKVLRTGKTLGSAWVFVDNFIEPAQDQEAALEQRLIPYAYIVEPHMIKNFAMDRMGNLSMVQYFDRRIKDNETVYHVIEWTLDTVSEYDDAGALVFRNDNALGKIPCVVFIGSDEELEEGEVPFPEYTNIYQLNAKMVNVDSLITNGMYQQGFAILCLAGEFDNEMEIGESAAINYDKNGEGQVDAPSFIAPPDTPIKTMMDYMEILKTQIQEQSLADFSTTKSEEQSGIAKRLDNLNRSEALENTAKMMEAIEERIMQLFGMYIDTDLQYSTIYYKYYDIDDIKTSLEETILALSIQWGSQDVVKKIKQRQLQKMFADYDINEVKDIIQGEMEAVVVEQQEETDDTQTETVPETTQTQSIDVSSIVDAIRQDIRSIMDEVPRETATGETEVVDGGTSVVEDGDSPITISNINSVSDGDELNDMVKQILSRLRMATIDLDQAVRLMVALGFDEAVVRPFVENLVS